jgi:hypothetical protein
MTLSIKISHNSPGYPVRALVSVRNSRGEEAYHGKTPLEDGKDATFYVHAGQWLHVTEDGHQDVDLEPIARRAYEAYCDAQHMSLTLWQDLYDREKQQWIAVARVFA